jgi:CxxC motif-containing protein (DUF1111 family)
MHDGNSLTLRDAILRHKNEADKAADHFEKLKPKDQQALLDFLRSL